MICTGKTNGEFLAVGFQPLAMRISNLIVLFYSFISLLESYNNISDYWFNYLQNYYY